RLPVSVAADALPGQAGLKLRPIRKREPPDNEQLARAARAVGRRASEPGSPSSPRLAPRVSWDRHCHTRRDTEGRTRDGTSRAVLASVTLPSHAPCCVASCLCTLPGVRMRLEGFEPPTRGLEGRPGR